MNDHSKLCETKQYASCILCSVIDKVDNIKYLGLHIDNHYSFQVKFDIDYYVKSIIRKLIFIFKNLRDVFVMKNLRILYNILIISFLHPVIGYGIGI